MTQLGELMGFAGGDPHALAKAIEDAMVADGYPAEGLAERAVAQGCTLRYQPHGWDPFPARRGSDPVVGVRGPAQP